MKVERTSGKEERQIITGMVVDPIVLAKVAPKWPQQKENPEAGLFFSRWANIVGALCVRYHLQYGSAPGKAIEGLVTAWAEKNRDRDTVDLVEKFLGGLSDEYEGAAKETNAAYVIDLAAQHFNRVRLKHTTEAIQGHLDAGEVDRATKAALEWTPFGIGGGVGINVLADKAALEKAFASHREPLIRMKGAVGQFFGDSLVREAFVVFLAPEKRGKTWELCEMAWRAMLQRRRVAFFSVGDESEDEMLLRFCVRAAKHPLLPDNLREPPGPVMVPIIVERDEEAADDDEESVGVRVEFEKQVFAAGLTKEQAEEAFYHTRRHRLKSRAEYLRLSVHPASSLSVRGMDAQLVQWEREGWTPDVIVVDYMDILQESGTGNDEMRHRINATWRDFRGLLQKWHALGIAATQSDADSYNARLMDRNNFSEDKRKLAHVTGMVGLNQTDPEKELGVMRLNWIVRRGSYFNTKRVCYVAGCLAIGNPMIRSCW